MKLGKYPLNSFSKLVNRLDFAKVKYPNFNPPDLKGIQIRAYDKFIKEDLKKLISSYFPIYSQSRSTEIVLEDVLFHEPEFSEDEALEKGKSFQYSIYIKVKLTSKQGKNTEQTAEDTIFLGNIPELTSRSNYIINGIEKFIISQIVRAPGTYILNRSQIKLTSSKKRVQEGTICELLPIKGSMLLFNYVKEKGGKYIVKATAKNNVGDSVVQFPVTVLFKALGMSEEQILELCDNVDYIQNTLDKEDYNPRDLIFKENSLYMKWFKANVLNVKDFDKWLEDSEDTIYKTLNRLSYDLYNKNWEKIGDLLSKLETAAADSTSSEEYLRVKDSLEKEIEKSRKILESITVEWASYFLINEFGISYESASYRVHSFQELLWSYLFERNYYDIGVAGRFKIDHKMALANRIFQKVLAQDVKDFDGNIVFPKGTFMGRAEISRFVNLSKEKKLDILSKTELPYAPQDFPNYKHYSFIELESLLIHKTRSLSSPVIKIHGVPQYREVEPIIRFGDYFAMISYIVHLWDEIGGLDDIDHLGNKRLKLVNELLQNRIVIAMSRIARFAVERVNNMEARINYATLRDAPDTSFVIKSILNTKPFQIVIREFFNSHQLTQFLDQQNPLSELTNKRKISAMGPGGIKREDPNLSIRDVHYSHYGKLCPVETPEGMNIGLIMALASFAQLNEFGFLVTPYYKVVDGKVTDEVHWLSALQEEYYIISEANVPRDSENRLIGSVTVRYKDSIETVDSKLVDYIDVGCHQLVSISASLIPFLEHNDANRALMGANMQRQAVPLLSPKSPIVGTGVEHKIATDSGLVVLAKGDGVITHVDGKSVTVKYDKSDLGTENTRFYKFERSNHSTCKNQYPLVRVGQKVTKGQALCNGPAMQNGELALGQNLLVAFTTWYGYNYEDAIILSSRLIEEDIYTSIHIQEHVVECMRTKIGDEEITRQIPYVTDSEKKYLDENGIIMVGAEVKEGDILVGKTSPTAVTEQTSEERLLQAIFSEKVKSVKDSSLRVPAGGGGIVTKIMRFSIYKNDKLNDDVIEVVKVFVVQKRKIQVGDKMAGRHGNKGIVSKIARREDMPYLEDGTPVDIIVNPLGVPSRMNIGQVLETHLGFAARKMVFKRLLELYFEGNKELASSVFGLDPETTDRLFKVMKDHLSEIGVKTLNDAKEMSQVNFTIILSKLGMSVDDLNIRISTPVFSGVTHKDLVDIMKEAEIDPATNNGKFTLINGRTGEKFAKPITVGVIYMLKLDHMVDDKIHARSVGAYSKITQQPLGGKCQNGGQRFGEMEVWALEAYGAAYNLRELLTIKSDDIQSRQSVFSSIIKKQPLPTPNIPESFKLLIKKLEGACMKINVQYGDENKFISCHEFIEKQLSRDTVTVAPDNSSNRGLPPTRSATVANDFSMAISRKNSKTN
ncbi:DNA-directed RNA polymerase subunit beta [Candidatus Mycoplasma haematohominis]|uniref:DNA-directed RNA polymerase subunit beta n=1 Tax=Candidatus Mycoplasma haematohominis TaxID=1494318 RepID=A0A478FPM9_9MOLU|nr:DNA-directed RNA polymerase subunit beta [Candidatus Mycoplasma haemohominis]